MHYKMAAPTTSQQLLDLLKEDPEPVKKKSSHWWLYVLGAAGVGIGVFVIIRLKSATDGGGGGGGGGGDEPEVFPTGCSKTDGNPCDPQNAGGWSGPCPEGFSGPGVPKYKGNPLDIQSCNQTPSEMESDSSIGNWPSPNSVCLSTKTYQGDHTKVDPTYTPIIPDLPTPLDPISNADKKFPKGGFAVKCPNTYPSSGSSILFMPSDWDPTTEFSCPKILYSSRDDVPCTAKNQGAIAVDANNYHDLYRCNNKAWQKAIDGAYNSEDRVTYFSTLNGKSYTWGAWGNTATCTKQTTEWEPYARTKMILGCLNYKNEPLDSVYSDGFLAWLRERNGWIASYAEVKDYVDKNAFDSVPNTYSYVSQPLQGGLPFGAVDFNYDGKGTVDQDPDSIKNIPVFDCQYERCLSAWVWLPESVGKTPTPYTWLTKMQSTFINI